MPKAILSALTFDALGHIELDLIPSSKTADFSRRVTRIQTLSGGVAVNDFGFADGDRTMTLTWATLEEADEQNLRRVAQSHSRLYVTTDDGVFLVAPESYRTSNGESTLSLLALEKVTT